MGITVVGATGFVGRHLVSHLASHGHEVTAVSRSGELVTGATNSIEQLEIGDPVNPLPEAPHAVIYLTGIAHRGKSEHPDVYDLVNRRGAVHWLKWSAAQGIPRFIYISSSKVHGVGNPDPIDESSPLLATDAYSRSKIDAEAELMDYAKQIDVICLRPPIVYGPDAKGNVALLRRLASSALPLPVTRRPVLRSMVSIENLVDALRTVVVADRSGSGSYLVADRDPVSTFELYESFASAIDRRPNSVSIPSSALRLLDAVASPIVGRKPLEALYSPFVLDSSKFRTAYGWDAQ